MFHYYLVLGLRNLLAQSDAHGADGADARRRRRREHLDAHDPARDVGQSDPAQERAAARAAGRQRARARATCRARQPEDKQMSYTRRGRTACDVAARASMRTAVYDVNGAIERLRADLPVEQIGGLAVDSDYFAMFEVPFLYGNAWTRGRGRRARRASSCSAARRARSCSATTIPSGRRIRVFGHGLPRRRRARHVEPGAALHAPHQQLRRRTSAARTTSTSRSPPRSDIELLQQREHELPGRRSRARATQGFLESECTWIQFWFQTNRRDRAGLADYLDDYASEQRKLGRLKRDAPVQLFDVMEWMRYLEVVSNDTRLAVWLAFGFLLLCLVNTTGSCSPSSRRARRKSACAARWARRKARSSGSSSSRPAWSASPAASLGLVLSAREPLRSSRKQSRSRCRSSRRWTGRCSGSRSCSRSPPACSPDCCRPGARCQVTPALQLKSQ